MSKQPTCRCCSKDTPKRFVTKRKPLKDITDEIPKHPCIKKEYLCQNETMVKHPWGKDNAGKPLYKWFPEICENHILLIKRGKSP